ncbi:hypothetical protein [Methylocystis sp.]|uniref:hypothetical protein n=1 Tax=Methylocystis sp. TaxID=1911079 RepID=UPI0025D3FF53|nr:hypothetical protein [Methylocystis sp.]
MTKDEARAMLDMTRQLAEATARLIARWADTIDPEKLSAEEAEEIAKALKQLRKAGALRTH